MSEKTKTLYRYSNYMCFFFDYVRMVNTHIYYFILVFMIATKLNIVLNYNT